LQSIELVCFLRVSLLELTDIAVQQNLRRSRQLFHEATQRVRTTRERSDSVATLLSIVIFSGTSC
jgi:hypothetical protein